jgi:hypothetical protein
MPKYVENPQKKNLWNEDDYERTLAESREREEIKNKLTELLVQLDKHESEQVVEKIVNAILKGVADFDTALNLLRNITSDIDQSDDKQ